MNRIIKNQGIEEQLRDFNIEDEELVPENLDSLNNLTSFKQRKK